MYNLIKAELYKLKSSKELLISLIVLSVVGVISIYYGPVKGAKASLSSQSREMFGLMACTLFAVTYVGKDFIFKTINHTLTSGHARGKVILSKYACYLIACVILLLANYLFMGGLYSVFYGWGQVFDSRELYFLIVYIVIGVFFDLCIASIPFFICILVKNTSVAIALSCGVIGLIFTLSQLPWDTLAYGVASKDVSLGTLPLIFVISFIFGTSLLYLICHYYFNKQDI